MASRLNNPTTMVGGQRVVAKKKTGNDSPTGQKTNVPANSGFQKYYGLTTSGIEMSQQSVLLFAIIYMGSVVIMHLISRIKA